MPLQSFPFRVILSSTTDRLLTAPKGPRDNGIGDLYRLLNHITGDNLFTHQLPRANEFCRPFLLALFPDFLRANEHLDELDRMLQASSDPQEAINAWLYVVAAHCGTTADAKFAVPSLPPDSNWISMDPLEELKMMAPNAHIIVIKPED